MNLEELISKLWHWILLRLLFVLIATLLGEATLPLSDWIVRYAARRLPAKYREEFEMQWLGDFESLPPWLRLKSALGVLFAGRNQLGESAKHGSSPRALGASATVDLDALRSGLSFGEERTIDALTGLPNRRSFERIVSKLMLRPRWMQRDFCLILVDIDNLKPVNDRCGHSAGDVLLQELARRLKARLRWKDHICRCGGDEFAIALPDTSRLGAKQIAEDLRRTCEMLVKGSEFAEATTHTFKISASFGIVSRVREARLDDMLFHADAALYEAKSQGRNCVREYSVSD